MMGKLKGIGKYIVLVIVMITLWCLTLAYAQPIESTLTQVEIRYSNQKPTLNQVKEMEKYESNPFVAWHQTEELALKVEDFNRQTKAKIVEIYGEIALLLDRHKLQGNLLNNKDTEGILVTSTVADALWGSQDVIGYTLQIEDNDYTVRGVVEDKQFYIIKNISQHQQDKDYTVDTLRLDLEEVRNIDQTVNTLQNKYQLPQGIIHNIALKSSLLIQLMYVPFWLVGGYSLLKLYRFLYKYYRYWVLAILVGGIALVSTSIMLKIIPFELHIPTYIFPNQWSDFTFWTEIIEKYQYNKMQLNQLPIALPSVWLQQIYTTYTITLGLAIATTLIFLKMVRVRNNTMLFWQIASSGIIVFCCLMSLFASGIATVSHPVLWLLIPLSLGIHKVVEQLELYVSN